MSSKDWLERVNSSESSDISQDLSLSASCSAPRPPDLDNEWS